MTKEVKEYLKRYEDSAFVPFDKLERFMKEALIGAGVPKADAEIIADVLIESDKRGIDSHGIGRLKPIYIDRIDLGILNPVTEIEIIKEDKATAVLDGHNGMGHVVAHKAMAMAIDKAKKNGIAMTVVRNSTHYGIAGYYATMATAEDLIGITGTNARPSIAPTFGVENMLGTNPLTIGLPTDDPFPFVLDCATSVSQRGKIEVYGRAGKDVPPGWVIDESGNTRVDTARDLVLKLYNTTNEMIKTAQLAEMAIVFGNRYRTVYDEVDSGLSDAENLFFKGEYKRALDVSIKAVSMVDENIYRKLLAVYDR